jgi:hypothetical protein
MSNTFTRDAIRPSHRPQTLRCLIESFVKIASSSASRRGRDPWWTPQRLIVMLVLMAWGRSRGLLDRFEEARPSWSQTHTANTYQGFIKALRRMGHDPIDYVAATLRQRLSNIAGPMVRCYGFFVLAADGSRFELPRTRANERYFGINKKRSSPQMCVTMLWQLAVGTPFNWRIGKNDASERHQLREMIDETPADTLFAMDAGFTGYDLLRQIVDGGRHFLVRVGKHVELLRELGDYTCEDDQTVYLWPARERNRNHPPLVLRLVCVRKPGKQPVYLLTSVCDTRRLSDKKCAKLYRLRWEVELGYRALKQTLEKRKLCSKSAINAIFEMQGLLLGLMVLSMASVVAITQAGHKPLDLSFAEALRHVRRHLGGHRRVDWSHRLADAVKDQYKRRRKTRRDWPRKKQNDPPPGPPRQRRATRSERQSYAALLLTK